MQLSKVRNGRQTMVKDLPDFNNERLAAGEFPLHKVDVQIEIFVIQLIDHIGPDQCAQLLQVYNEPCQGIGFALDGHNQVKIMSVPILVRTGAEYLNILFMCPGRVVQLMSGIEMLLTTDVDHGINFGANIEPPAALSKPASGRRHRVGLPLIQLDEESSRFILSFPSLLLRPA